MESGESRNKIDNIHSLSELYFEVAKEVGKLSSFIEDQKKKKDPIFIDPDEINFIHKFQNKLKLLATAEGGIKLTSEEEWKEFEILLDELNDENKEDENKEIDPSEIDFIYRFLDKLNLLATAEDMIKLTSQEEWKEWEILLRKNKETAQGIFNFINQLIQSQQLQFNSYPSQPSNKKQEKMEEKVKEEKFSDKLKKELGNKTADKPTQTSTTSSTSSTPAKLGEATNSQPDQLDKLNDFYSKKIRPFFNKPKEDSKYTEYQENTHNKLYNNLSDLYAKKSIGLLIEPTDLENFEAELVEFANAINEALSIQNQTGNLLQTASTSQTSTTRSGSSVPTSQTKPEIISTTVTTKKSAQQIPSQNKASGEASTLSPTPKPKKDELINLNGIKLALLNETRDLLEFLTAKYTALPNGDQSRDTLGSFISSLKQQLENLNQEANTEEDLEKFNTGLEGLKSDQKLIDTLMMIELKLKKELEKLSAELNENRSKLINLQEFLQNQGPNLFSGKAVNERLAKRLNERLADKNREIKEILKRLTNEEEKKEFIALESDKKAALEFEEKGKKIGDLKKGIQQLEIQIERFQKKIGKVTKAYDDIKNVNKLAEQAFKKIREEDTQKPLATPQSIATTSNPPTASSTAPSPTLEKLIKRVKDILKEIEDIQSLNLKTHEKERYENLKKKIDEFGIKLNQLSLIYKDTPIKNINNPEHKQVITNTANIIAIVEEAIQATKKRIQPKEKTEINIEPKPKSKAAIELQIDTYSLPQLQNNIKNKLKEYRKEFFNLDPAKDTKNVNYSINPNGEDFDKEFAEFEEQLSKLREFETDTVEKAVDFIFDADNKILKNKEANNKKLKKDEDKGKKDAKNEEENNKQDQQKLRRKELINLKARIKVKRREFRESFFKLLNPDRPLHDTDLSLENQLIFPSTEAKLFINLDVEAKKFEEDLLTKFLEPNSNIKYTAEALITTMQEYIDFNEEEQEKKQFIVYYTPIKQPAIELRIENTKDKEEYSNKIKNELKNKTADKLVDFLNNYIKALNYAAQFNTSVDKIAIDIELLEEVKAVIQQLQNPENKKNKFIDELTKNESLIKALAKIEIKFKKRKLIEQRNDLDEKKAVLKGIQQRLLEEKGSDYIKKGEMANENARTELNNRFNNRVEEIEKILNTFKQKDKEKPNEAAALDALKFQEEDSEIGDLGKGVQQLQIQIELYQKKIDEIDKISAAIKKVNELFGQDFKRITIEAQKQENTTRSASATPTQTSTTRSASDRTPQNKSETISTELTLQIPSSNKDEANQQATQKPETIILEMEKRFKELKEKARSKRKNYRKIVFGVDDNESVPKELETYETRSPLIDLESAKRLDREIVKFETKTLSLLAKTAPEYGMIALKNAEEIAENLFSCMNQYIKFTQEEKAEANSKSTPLASTQPSQTASGTTHTASLPSSSTPTQTSTTISTPATPNKLAPQTSTTRSASSVPTPQNNVDESKQQETEKPKKTITPELERKFQVLEEKIKQKKQKYMGVIFGTNDKESVLKKIEAYKISPPPTNLELSIQLYSNLDYLENQIFTTNFNYAKSIPEEAEMALKGVEDFVADLFAPIDKDIESRQEQKPKKENSISTSSASPPSSTSTQPSQTASELPNIVQGQASTNASTTPNKIGKATNSKQDPLDQLDDFYRNKIRPFFAKTKENSKYKDLENLEVTHNEVQQELSNLKLQKFAGNPINEGVVEKLTIKLVDLLRAINQAISPTTQKTADVKTQPNQTGNLLQTTTPTPTATPTPSIPSPNLAQAFLNSVNEKYERYVKATPMPDNKQLELHNNIKRLIVVPVEPYASKLTLTAIEDKEFEELQKLLKDEDFINALNNIATRLAQNNNIATKLDQNNLNVIKDVIAQEIQKFQQFLAVKFYLLQSGDELRNILNRFILKITDQQKNLDSPVATLEHLDQCARDFESLHNDEQLIDTLQKIDVKLKQNELGRGGKVAAPETFSPKDPTKDATPQLNPMKSNTLTTSSTAASSSTGSKEATTSQSNPSVTFSSTTSTSPSDEDLDDLIQIAQATKNKIGGQNKNTSPQTGALTTPENKVHFGPAATNASVSSTSTSSTVTPPPPAVGGLDSLIKQFEDIKIKQVPKKDILETKQNAVKKKVTINEELNKSSISEISSEEESNELTKLELKSSKSTIEIEKKLENFNLDDLKKEIKIKRNEYRKKFFGLAPSENPQKIIYPDFFSENEKHIIDLDKDIINFESKLSKASSTGIISPNLKEEAAQLINLIDFAIENVEGIRIIDKAIKADLDEALDAFDDLQKALGKKIINKKDSDDFKNQITENTDKINELLGELNKLNELDKKLAESNSFDDLQLDAPTPELERAKKIKALQQQTKTILENHDKLLEKIKEAEKEPLELSGTPIKNWKEFTETDKEKTRAFVINNKGLETYLKFILERAKNESSKEEIKTLRAEVISKWKTVKAYEKYLSELPERNDHQTRILNNTKECLKGLYFLLKSDQLLGRKLNAKEILINNQIRFEEVTQADAEDKQYLIDKKTRENGEETTVDKVIKNFLQIPEIKGTGHSAIGTGKKGPKTTKANKENYIVTCADTKTTNPTVPTFHNVTVFDPNEAMAIFHTNIDDIKETDSKNRDTKSMDAPRTTAKFGWTSIPHDSIMAHAINTLLILKAEHPEMITFRLLENFHEYGSKATDYAESFLIAGRYLREVIGIKIEVEIEKDNKALLKMCRYHSDKKVPESEIKLLANRINKDPGHIYKKMLNQFRKVHKAVGRYMYQHKERPPGDVQGSIPPRNLAIRPSNKPKAKKV